MTLIQALINCIETYYKNELTELQSQVDDLQEQVRNTNTQSNLKDWEIKFLKEDVKRLNAKTYEKRHLLQTKDTEDKP